MMQFSFIGTRLVNNICMYTNTIETCAINIKIFIGKHVVSHVSFQKAIIPLKKKDIFHSIKSTCNIHTRSRQFIVKHKKVNNMYMFVQIR